jgi:dienelactone hydrolase
MLCFHIQQRQKKEPAKKNLVRWRHVLCLLLLLSLTACVQSGNVVKIPKDPDRVSFKSTHPKDASLSGPLSLSGRLTKPAGNGPFPAVVLLHGCGGVSPARDNRWVERLVDWGYVTLQVDSLGPRGIDSVCTYKRMESLDIVARRVQDAYDARDFLASLPFIDGNKIAVMGWSHGGLTTLEVLFARQIPFRAGVALYPQCNRELIGLNAPLIILIGGADDWTPAKSCTAMMPKNEESPGVILKVYPGAHHGFDNRGANRNVMGAGGSHHLQYDEGAEADAVIQVKNHLQKYMR